MDQCNSKLHIQTQSQLWSFHGIQVNKLKQLLTKA
jgi:hypothetical protein